MLKRLHRIPVITVWDVIFWVATSWVFFALDVTLPEGIAGNAVETLVANTAKVIIPFFAPIVSRTLFALLRQRTLLAVVLAMVGGSSVATMLRGGAFPSSAGAIAGWFLVTLGVVVAAGVVILLFILVPRVFASDEWLDQHVESWSLAGPLLKEELCEHGPLYFGAGPPDPIEQLTKQE